ncbi:penicillin-binding protein 1A [Arcticibacter tournemirensis]
MLPATGTPGTLFEYANTMQITLLRFILKSFVIIALVLLLSFFIFYFCIYSGFFGKIPSENELKSKQNSIASELYTADSVLIGRYFIQDRKNVRFEEISKHVISALIATEDARFYRHNGIDVRSLARVFFKTFLAGDEQSGGGSTLSQQLAKNLYPRQRQPFLSTPINKIKEMIIAQRIESIYSKKEVLELYLNTVPMGGNIYGIERASEVYFGKVAMGLKTEEAAVLVGMLKANTTYNPAYYPTRSLERRNFVIDQMVKYNYLDDGSADSIKNLPLKLNLKRRTVYAGIAPYFSEQLRLELVKWCQSQTKADGEPYNLYTDGLKIYTTIDSRIQKEAEKAVKSQMSRLQYLFNQHWKGRNLWRNNGSVIQTAMQQSLRYKRLKEAGKSSQEIREIFNTPVKMTVFTWVGNKKRTMSPLDSIKYYQSFLNTGLLSIEPGTGYIRAWVGGINHQFFKYDHVLSRRQAGSTFKPVVYAAALEKGINPCRYFPNVRISYPQFENWSPQNSDNQYGGKYTMRGALSHSVNTVSTQILIRTGIKPAIALARRMGIESDIPEVPSIALGTAALSLFEMVKAYTTFSNSGRAIEPIYITSITDQKNTILLQRNHSVSHQAISPQNAAIMIDFLKGAVDGGSAVRLRTKYGLSMEIAGKTGTTQNQADGWFIGITPDLVTGVWVGAENPAVHFRTLEAGQGASTALPVWAHFMLNLSKKDDFAGYRSSRFDALPRDLQARLDCPPFVPEEVKEEPPKKRESFFKRIFKKGLNLFKKKKKDESNDV